MQLFKNSKPLTAKDVEHLTTSSASQGAESDSDEDEQDEGDGAKKNKKANQRQLRALQRELAEDNDETAGGSDDDEANGRNFELEFWILFCFHLL